MPPPQKKVKPKVERLAWATPLIYASSMNDFLVIFIGSIQLNNMTKNI